eukprot:Em0214g2a
MFNTIVGHYSSKRIQITTIESVEHNSAEAASIEDNVTDIVLVTYGIQIRPADYLVPNWSTGKPAAFDISVTSPLNPISLPEAKVTVVLQLGWPRCANTPPTTPSAGALGWVCIPLAVENLRVLGTEARDSSRLAVRLALQLHCSKSKALVSIYQRLNLTLVRCAARALLSRVGTQTPEGHCESYGFWKSPCASGNILGRRQANCTEQRAFSMGLVVLWISYIIVAHYGPDKFPVWCPASCFWKLGILMMGSSRERSAVIRALHLIEDLGALQINFSKCELFSRSGNSLFPPVVKSSLLPNLDILGAPIGDSVHCSRFIAEKCAMPKILLKALVDVSTVDLHMAFSLLRMAIPKPKMLGDIYGHLNMSLVRSVARAIMGRENVRIDLLPWASWCYGQQPLLQHPLGTLTSEVGVQQSDPLGPMFFSLVLHKLVSAIATDEDTAKLLFHAWPLNCFLRLRRLALLTPKWMCGAFCKMVHLARSTPSSLVAEGFRYFDNDVRHCLASCTGVDTSDDAWEQAQLSLSRGGLGFRRLSKHSPACYIASVCMSGLFSAPQQHLLQSIDDFNHCIPPSKAISFESLTNTPSSQKAISGEFEDELFRQLLSKSSVPDRARLLSVSSPHASAWLSVVPSPGLNLHLEPAEFQAAIQWWLGIGVAHGSVCSHCPHSLDPLGHHALTCKHGWDVVNRHNRLRNVFAESCRRACIGVQVEAGSGLGRHEHHTRPADVLATNWMLGKPAAFDFAVTSPLDSSPLHEASVTAGSAAHATEARKHQENDVKCAELGWVSIPVVVETYECWGTEAKWALSQLVS